MVPSVMSNLVGTWERVDIANLANPEREFWHFTKDQSDGGNVKMEWINGTSSNIHTNTNYAIETTLRSCYINILNGPSYFSSGETRWEIAKLNKDVMIITVKQGGTIIYEFNKR